MRRARGFRERPQAAVQASVDQQTSSLLQLTVFRSVLCVVASMVVCEHLVLAAASCHEYELLSEAMEALLHKAQVRCSTTPHLPPLHRLVPDLVWCLCRPSSSSCVLLSAGARWQGLAAHVVDLLHRAHRLQEGQGPQQVQHTPPALLHRRAGGWSDCETHAWLGMGGWSRLLRFFKAALQFNGFSKTVLLNIVLAALCENGQGATATYYIQVSQ